MPPAFTLVSCSAYFWNLKIEAALSSQTLVDFQRTTRRYIPEVITVHNHRCENLKSYVSRYVPNSVPITLIVPVYFPVLVLSFTFK
jgi:ABC-type transport system involved in cytochrome bd biosynthesis fused ATPase/permease subunit